MAHQTILKLALVITLVLMISTAESVNRGGKFALFYRYFTLSFTYLIHINFLILMSEKKALIDLGRMEYLTNLPFYIHNLFCIYILRQCQTNDFSIYFLLTIKLESIEP